MIESMRTILKPRTLGIFLGLMLLCSCARMPDPSAIVPASELPADVIMNKEAGRGGDLTVTLWLESGEELPFVLDTGAQVTVLDKSLEPKLGKRLETTTILLPRDKQDSGVYAAPKLYLGSTPLVTGSNIITYDFKPLSSRSPRPNMGFLGMDCLMH